MKKPIDWERVEKLRRKGASWTMVASDPTVGFRPVDGDDPGRSLRALYRRHYRQSGNGSPRDGIPETTKRDPNRRLGRTPKIAFAAVAVALVLVVAYVAIHAPTVDQKPTGWVGRIAPNCSLPVANGEGTFTLSSERGHQDVLLFFNEGLGCSGCLQQMQALDGDWQEFQSIHVLIVSITGDSVSELSSWASNAGVSHTVVLADPTLAVSNDYDTTGASVSMMPGSAPGHTFLLVSENGTVLWRDDYGPQTMWVPDDQIYQAVQSALGI